MYRNHWCHCAVWESGLVSGNFCDGRIVNHTSDLDVRVGDEGIGLGEAAGTSGGGGLEVPVCVTA